MSIRKDCEYIGRSKTCQRGIGLNAKHGTPSADPWPAWLGHDRHAGDPEFAPQLHAAVARYVDRLLDNAELAPNLTLLDVGSGDGVVAWRALARTGPTLQVIVSEPSEVLLAQARAHAERLGVMQQCRFLQRGAEALGELASASVDVVTTRSVLAYVADKRAALREFHRVLKPGGRIALAEPVFQDEAFEANLLRHRLATQPDAAQDMALRLLHRWKAAQFPDTLEAIARSPLCCHSERDLLRFALGEGFTDLHLELDIRIAPSAIRSWQVYLDVTPHPWAPSLRTILAERCSDEERALFERLLRPAVEAGTQTSNDRMVYLTARKPALA